MPQNDNVSRIHNFEDGWRAAGYTIGKNCRTGEEVFVHFTKGRDKLDVCLTWGEADALLRGLSCAMSQRPQTR